jgi:hypothetical protein
MMGKREMALSFIIIFIIMTTTLEFGSTTIASKGNLAFVSAVQRPQRITKQVPSRAGQSSA